MPKRLLNDTFVLSATALLAAGAGFVGAAFYLDRPDPNADGRSVLAECGFAAGQTISESTLRLRCGLEQAEIEALFAAAVEGLGFDGLRAGHDPTRAQIEEAGRALGLTVDAVEALIADLRAGDDAAADTTQAIDWAIEVAVTPSDASGSSEPDATVPVRFAPQDLVVGKEDSPAEAVLLAGVRAKCGAAVGEAIAGSVIDIVCGPEPEEVQALIERFVQETGANGIHAALQHDQAARQNLIDQLSASFGLEDRLVAALLAELEATELTDAEATQGLDQALRARLYQAMLLLKIGTIGDVLKTRQSDIAAAVVAGDAAAAERLVRETGEMLRPLADDLAPETLPPLVAAARLAEEAAASVDAGDYLVGIRSYARAGNQVRSDWPLLAQSFDLAAASVLADDRAQAAIRAELGGADDAATTIWLDVSGALHRQAIDLGLAAADRLSRQGETTIDDALLREAADVLARLEPLVTREDDPQRYVSLQAERASLLRELAQRDGDLATLRRAEAAADAAIETAETLGEDAVLRRLTGWAIVQLDLGRWTGDTRFLDAALEAFERVAASRDADRDLAGWASAQNNIAVVQSDKAELDRDAELLSAAADTYRGIARRIDPAIDPAAWALYTRNLANTLDTLGAWQRSQPTVREAIAELEKLRAFEADGAGAGDLAAANTIEKLAQSWWQLGWLSGDTDAHAKAAELMGEAIEIYDPDTAARHRVNAQLQLGDIRRDAGRVASDAAAYRAAAEAYAAARATADASGQRRLYVEGTLGQARVLHRAAALGDRPDDAPDPGELVAEASLVIDAVPDDAITSEWERLRGELAELSDEIGQSDDR